MINIDWKLPITWVILLIMGLIGNFGYGVWHGSRIVYQLEQIKADVHEGKLAIREFAALHTEIAVLRARVDGHDRYIQARSLGMPAPAAAARGQAP